MKKHMIATVAFLCSSFSLAQGQTIEVTKRAGLIQIKSSFVQVEQANSAGNEEVQKQIIYAVAVFGNGCQVPSSGELLTTAQFSENKVSYKLLSVGSGRICPAVYRPVSRVIKVAEMTTYKNSNQYSYSVNDLEAKLAENADIQNPIAVVKFGNVLTINDAYKESVASRLPGGYDYIEYNVYANSTFGNSCSVPESDSLVTAISETEEKVDFTLVQIHDGKMCPAVYQPVTVTFKVGNFYQPVSKDLPVSVNGVSAQ